MFDRKYVALLEQELREWKIRYAELELKNRKLVDTVFAVQGAPAPFREDNHDEVVARKTDEEFLRELELAAIATHEELGDVADMTAAQN